MKTTTKATTKATMQSPPYRLPLFATPIIAASFLASVASSCGGKSEEAKAAGAQSAAQVSSVSGAPSSTEAASVRSSVSKVVALGRVEPEQKIATLSSDVAGIVQKIYAREGATVKAGDVLVELAHDLETAKLASARAKSATQISEIASLKASLQSAQIKAQNQKERYERLQKILQSGAETQQNVDNAKTDYETANREVERLQASLQSAQSRLMEFNAETNVAAIEVARRLLRAPSNGQVLDITPTLGSALSSGASVVEFAPSGAVTVLCEVDELFVDKVQRGQKATIRAQGSANVLAEGEVMEVGAYLKKKSIFSDEAGALEDRRVREVRVKITSPHSLLFNSRVECVIAVK